jgi:hypothetical protein
MGRFLSYALLGFALTLCFFSTPSQADGGAKKDYWIFGHHWAPSHWRNQDFIPYFENGTEPHNQTTQPQNWSPERWINTTSHKNGLSLINQWYVSDILRDQYVDDGVPNLVVGPNFYHLGGTDKRKVMSTLDHVYQATSQSPKMFYIRDWKTDEVIGYYTPSGLILQ